MSDDGASRQEALDETLLGFLAAGWSHEQAAAACGISTKTVQRRVRDGAFGSELARRRTLRVDALTARLNSISDRAVDVIVESFDSANPTVRLRAADLALTWAVRTRREVDLEARIARLEDDSNMPGDKTNP